MPRLSRLLTKTTDGVETKYVYGLGLIGEESCSTFKTYHFDARGSTVAITDSAGAITEQFSYDTYGKLLCNSASGCDSETPFLYNGMYGVMTDPNGLCYMRARYYSPELRRFINTDPVHGKISDAITLNRYAYANGNPVSFVDPFGLSAERGSVFSNLEEYFSNLDFSEFLSLILFAGLDSEDALKWIVQNILRPTILELQEILSKIDLTQSNGLCLNFATGIFAFSIQIGVATDMKGNLALHGSFNGGISTGTPGLSLGVYKTTAFAPSVDDLLNDGYQIGGSLVVPIFKTPLAIIAGADFNIFPSDDKLYFGFTEFEGIGTIGPNEVHIEWGRTANIGAIEVNIFDLALSFCDKILEE